ncbi:Leucine aminopeptidase 1 [Dinochytrium kinnereticum]|nr:Leucine aminopeptidase 1 [Dinochytrium kinnereticum]
MILISAATIIGLAASAAALRTPPLEFGRREEVHAENFTINNLAALTKGPAVPIAIPSTTAFQTVVNPLLDTISQADMTQWIIDLTQFPDRYYKSPNGIKAANWIRDQALALQAPAGAKLTVSMFEHSWKIQPSVIARYEPATPTGQEGIVITGSHFDTIAYGSGRPEPNANPAADDCASGSAVVFETLRTLIKNKFIPGRPIEFHWYAAEEVGLYGSDEIAEAYALAGTKVVSYLNLDQSGYVKKGTTPVMGVITDYTTTASTNLIKNVITSYTNLKWVASKCGYACTDHASWYSHGYEAALAFESSMANAFPYNDRVNADGSFLDTLDKLDYSHIYQFVRSTLGFVVELSLTGGSKPPTPTTSVVVTPTTTPAPVVTPATITVAPTLAVVVLTKAPAVPATPAPVVGGTTTVTLTVAPTYAVSVATAAPFGGRLARRAVTTMTVTVAPNIQLSVATAAAALVRRGGAGNTPAPTTTATAPAKIPVTFTVAPTLSLKIVN